MKISFSFTGEESINEKALASVVLDLIQKYTTGDFESLKIRNGALFLNLFDENGEEFELLSDKGKVNYVIKDEPYKLKSKNLSKAMPYGHRDADGNFVTEAYVYERYT